MRKADKDGFAHKEQADHTVAAKDYRQEAIDYAKQELKYRRVDLSELDSEDEDSIEESERVPNAEAESGSGSGSGSVNPLVTNVAGKCVCGGSLRQGTLVAEKELTIIFTDNHEERFVRVVACSSCGQISLLVDPETAVPD